MRNSQIFCGILIDSISIILTDENDDFHLVFGNNKTKGHLNGTVYVTTNSFFNIFGHNNYSKGFTEDEKTIKGIA
jgi:hypothetical protein